MWLKLSEFAGVPAWRTLVSVGLTAFTMWRAYNALIYADLVGYFTVGLLTAMLVVMAGRRLAWITVLLVVGASLLAGLLRAGAVSFLPHEWIALIGAVIAPIVTLFAFQKLVSVRPWLGVVLFPVLALVFSLGVALPRNATNSIYYKSVYIEMDDGVRLAADYYLPRSWNGEALPTIVTLTRYHCAARLNFPFNILIPQGSGNRQRLGDAGYATMAVDVHGTGASFGTRENELSAREIQDSVSVVDWIIDQPWSNGVVGAEGVSYSATTAELLGLQRHPAVKAVVSNFALFDAYDDASCPNGLENTHITSVWGAINGSLDANELPEGISGLPALAWGGVRPVGGLQELNRAVAEHRDNGDSSDLLGKLQFRDQNFGRPNLFRGAPMNFLPSHQDPSFALLAISGWQDGGYGAANFKRLANTDSTNLYIVLGPWDHGPSRVTDPCGTTPTSRLGRRTNLTLPFYDYYLKGIDNGYEDTARIRYFRMCGGGWRGTQTWPPSNEADVLHVHASGLSEDSVRAEEQIEFSVDAAATTGPHSAWSSLVQLPGQPAKTDYGNRADAQGILSFDGPILEQSLEVSGHPTLTISMSANDVDGALIGYIEDVAPDGSTAYVTEEGLRLMSRKIMDNPHYRDYVPVRSHNTTDVEPMPVDEVTTIELGFLPTSYQFKAGHRIRLSLAGADADNFRPLENQASIYTFKFRPEYANELRLPLDRTPKQIELMPAI